MIQQLASCKLAHVIQCMFEPLGIEVRIKQDRMQMSWHDHISVDPQIFVFDTKIETLCDDFTGVFIDEHRKPFHDGKGDVIDAHSSDNAITFHAADYIPTRKTSARQFGKLRPSVNLFGSVEDLRQAERLFVSCKENRMKIRLWIAYAIAIIVYALVISLVVLIPPIMDRSVQLSPMGEFISTGISIFAVTLGIAIGIKYYYAKGKK